MKKKMKKKKRLNLISKIKKKTKTSKLKEKINSELLRIKTLLKKNGKIDKEY